MQDALSAGQGENITRKLSKLSIKVPRGVNMTPISARGPPNFLPICQIHCGVQQQTKVHMKVRNHGDGPY